MSKNAAIALGFEEMTADKAAAARITELQAEIRNLEEDAALMAEIQTRLREVRAMTRTLKSGFGRWEGDMLSQVLLGEICIDPVPLYREQIKELQEEISQL